MNEENTTTPQSLREAFEQLARSADSRVEQTSLSRSLHEAVAANPGELSAQWNRWLLDAGRAVGMAVDSFEASPDAAYHLADSGASLLTWHEPTGKFLLLSRYRRSRVCEYLINSMSTPAPTTVRQFVKRFGSSGEQQKTKWIVVGATPLQSHDSDEPRINSQHSGAHHTGAHHSRTSPISRFLSLLRPEFGDVLVLLALGLFVGLLATAVPIAGQQLVRTVTFGTLYQPIIVLSLLLLLFLGFMGALQTMSVVVVELIQQRLFARTVAEFSQRLPRAEYSALKEANGPELVNRFLEIATVQKVVAGLLVDGLALLLTTLIGMSLLAFYHPYLLSYDVLLVALLLFAVLVLGRGGTRTAINESIEKYRIAAWLEDIVRCSLAFRLAGGADFAVARADHLTAGYLTARKAHFQVLLRQILCLFAIQAVASTTLLGLGGYLVMHEQLSLGQLVAAELIVTMIVGAFAKLAKHIEGFFDLMAAMDKLGHLIDLPVEQGGQTLRIPNQGPLLAVKDMPVHLVTDTQHHKTNSQSHAGHSDLTIESGQHTAVLGGSGTGKSHLADLLFGVGHSDHSSALVGGCDTRELVPETLRRHVALCRSTETLAGTIVENIHMGRAEVDTARIRQALDLVGLSDEISKLPEGLHSRITCEGSPLSDSQLVRLTIARAIAGHPKLLVIDGLIDRLPDELMAQVVESLQQPNLPWTLLIVTGREDVARRCPVVYQL